MRKDFAVFIIICMLLSACHVRPDGETPIAIVEGITADSLRFDLSKYKSWFQYRNDLHAVPSFPHVYDSVSSEYRLDSAMLHHIYQDSIIRYWYDDVGSGSRLYGYIDTFAGFDAICIFTGRGDAGDVYDLLTMTKTGRRIDMVSLSYIQGEEDIWDYNETAVLQGRHITIQATACRYTDTLGHRACDTLRRAYRISDAGRILQIGDDTVLNTALDSMRRENPY